MKHCSRTTKRMIDFVLERIEYRFVFVYEGVRPHGPDDSWAADIATAEVGNRMRSLAHELRREAKERRLQLRHRLAAIGSFDRVDWTLVAHAVMCASNPFIAAKYEREVAQQAAVN